MSFATSWAYIICPQRLNDSGGLLDHVLTIVGDVWTTSRRVFFKQVWQNRRATFRWRLEYLLDDVWKTFEQLSKYFYTAIGRVRDYFESNLCELLADFCTTLQTCCGDEIPAKIAQRNPQCVRVKDFRCTAQTRFSALCAIIWKRPSFVLHACCAPNLFDKYK